MNKTRLKFLGTGTSQGVPMIGCGCDVCRSRDPRDKRLRASVLVEYEGLTILVDAGPDFRQQMLREGVSHLDAILLTHNHKDHTGGLDDIRAFNYLEKRATEIYCEKYVEDALRMEYSYAFAEKKYPGAPEWHVHNIDENPFEIRCGGPYEVLSWEPGMGYVHSTAGQDDPVKTARIIPIRGMHYKLPVLGYRFGDIAYCTDMNHIPEEEFAKLEGLEHFVINCVKYGKHISHYSIEEAIEVAKRVGAKHTWLTHLSHQLPCYNELAAELPAGILPAYDGLVISSNK
ncbi:MAG: MBL fold metallo-hydrolase [Bacteroidales bacterium]|nr:MBL fold metallo-hydrolase [Bacteroidales bacterium]